MSTCLAPPAPFSLAWRRRGYWGWRRWAWSPPGSSAAWTACARPSAAKCDSLLAHSYHQACLIAAAYRRQCLLACISAPMSQKIGRNKPTMNMTQ